MRIHVLSDLHLEVRPFEAEAVAADLVVLAGDIANGADGVDWARRAFRAPVLYLAGNHEYYDGDFDEVQEQLRHDADERVRVLDRSVAVVDGVRFLGCTLWTDYSLAPGRTRAAVIEAARRKNPDYAKIRRGARRFA